MGFLTNVFTLILQELLKHIDQDFKALWKYIERLEAMLAIQTNFFFYLKTTDLKIPGETKMLPLTSLYHFTSLIDVAPPKN